MRVPARAMPCLTRPKLRKCPKCLERTHPRLPLHATPPTRYVCSFRSLLVVVSGDKNTLFFDTNPPLRHISGVVSLHASPPARTGIQKSDILHYMYNHLSEKLTLANLSKLFFMSESSFSEIWNCSAVLWGVKCSA